MAISRRGFLTGAAASGAVLLARPAGALAQALGPEPAGGAARASRLATGRWLVHADLHNHTLFSDGDGDPAEAFASMRSNGLDVAALTDHAVLGGPLGAVATACGGSCTSVRGIDETSWAETAELADGADDPGTFTAIRGFEWSSPTMGHVNVWFGEDWVDPERTLGLVGLEGLPGFLHEIPELGPPVGEPLENLTAKLPVVTGAMMRPFYDWLSARPGRPLLGGGADALIGFNHPGREPGRFGRFAFDARLTERLVSLELFNRDEDYLFEGVDKGQPSPLVECLEAGWRPGLLGVTDEHGTDWGAPIDKGRAGLWVTELSRAGVHEALRSRRFFATRERGLRVDATIGGAAMGTTLAHTSGPVEVLIDVDGGAEWVGRSLTVQVLRPGGRLPTVSDEVDITVPAPTEPVARFVTALDLADGAWVVLRIVDPQGQADDRASGPLGRGRAIAYVSPVHLTASGSSPPPVQEPTAASEAGPVADGSSPLPSAGAGGRLPATGVLAGPLATAAGLALGASLAGVAALRRAGHGAPADHGHGHDHPRHRDHPHRDGGHDSAGEHPAF